MWSQCRLLQAGSDRSGRVILTYSRRKSWLLWVTGAPELGERQLDVLLVLLVPGAVPSARAHGSSQTCRELGDRRDRGSVGRRVE